MATQVEASLVDAIVASLSMACQRDDIKRLRNMLRKLFGKDLKDMVMQTASKEAYTVDSPELKEAMRKALTLTCSTYGSAQCLKLLIHRLPGVLDLNQTDDDETPCLILAILGHHVEMAAFLIKNGADLNKRDKQQRTPLHMAVMTHQHDVIEILLAKRAAIDCQDIVGATPLHYVVQMCSSDDVDLGMSLDIMDQLMTIKGNVDCRDNRGKTPLMWAASNGCAEACRILVAHGACTEAADNNGNTALHIAAKEGQVCILTTLIKECRADINSRDLSKQSPLALAVASSQVNCIKTLLELGARDTVDKRGKSVPHVAAAAGSLPVVEKLQSSGFDFWRVTSRGELPIHFAAIAKHKDIVCHLLQHEKHGNPRGAVMKSCLHLAASSSNIDLMSRLLDMGVNINAIMTYQGIYNTPLDIAQQKSLSESSAFLLQHGGQLADHLMHNSALVVQRTMRRVAIRRKQTKQEQQEEEPSEMPLQDASDQPSEMPTQDTTGGQEGGEQQEEEPSKMPAEDMADQPCKMPAEDTVDQSCEMPTEDTADQPCEMPAEDSMDQPCEMPSQDTSNGQEGGEHQEEQPIEAQAQGIADNKTGIDAQDIKTDSNLNKNIGISPKSTTEGGEQVLTEGSDGEKVGRDNSAAEENNEKAEHEMLKATESDEKDKTAGDMDFEDEKNSGTGTMENESSQASDNLEQNGESSGLAVIHQEEAETTKNANESLEDAPHQADEYADQDGTWDAFEEDTHSSIEKKTSTSPSHNSPIGSSHDGSRVSSSCVYSASESESRETDDTRRYEFDSETDQSLNAVAAANGHKQQRRHAGLNKGVVKGTATKIGTQPKRRQQLPSSETSSASSAPLVSPKKTLGNKKNTSNRRQTQSLTMSESETEPLPLVRKSKRKAWRLKRLTVPVLPDAFLSTYGDVLTSESGLSVESIRTKVQRSVQQHEGRKAFAINYKEAHATRTASIPSFPIISPIKYLAGVRMRQLVTRKLEASSKDKHLRLPDIYKP